jgi:D-alanyl-D-alanine carboxypeptidase
MSRILLRCNKKAKKDCGTGHLHSGKCDRSEWKIGLGSAQDGITAIVPAYQLHVKKAVKGSDRRVGMLLSKMGRTLRCDRKLFFSVIVGLAALIGGLSVSVPVDAKPRFSAIAVDARTGKVLFAKDADGVRYPASLTKVMTLYLLFQDLEANKIRLSTKLRVSARAAAMDPSKLGLKPESTITVEDAIKALVTKSANDVAAAVAENLAGSESNFAAHMTGTAKELGMNKTVFRNASGLPDSAQVTTARDMATLSLRVQRDFPQYYPYFGIKSFDYEGKTIRTHNRLLGRYAGTDGIKTGYIRDSGFNLTTSARRGDKRLVGVVLGAASGKTRNAYMVNMLNRVFPKCKNGKTIAALAGSSKGAIEPAVAASPKSEKMLPEKPSAMELLVASAAELDEEAEASDETMGSTFKAVDAATESVKPQVLEAKIAEPPLPAKLPFEVKRQNRDNSWHIQIGAYPSKKDAQAGLKRILAGTSSKLVKNKPAFTVTVQKGDEIIYRARFSGFSEKTAKGACRQLSKRKVDCLALPPHS